MQKFVFFISLFVSVFASPVQETEFNDIQLDDNVGDLNITTSHKFLNLFDDRVNVLDNNLLSAWKDDFIQSAKNNLTQNAFAQSPIDALISKNPLKNKMTEDWLFNVDLNISVSTDDPRQPNFWIAAACNGFGNEIRNKFNLDTKFGISQSYLWFYDQLEKANNFLELIIEKSGDPFDIVHSLISQPINLQDNWTNIIDLVMKYGLVPLDVFPDNYQAQHPDKLIFILTQKLKEFALKIRQLAQQDADKVQEYKESCLQTVFNILALTLGTPPKPDDKFVWEFIDKEGKFNSLSISPTEFYLDHVAVDLGSYFGIMNDPRFDLNQLYGTGDKSMVNGSVAAAVNVGIDDMKNAALAMLQAGQPVYFLADIEVYANVAFNLFDNTAVDFSVAFDFNLDLNKKQRLLTGSGKDVVMVITGVHIDPTSDKPVRWKVQASWAGIEIGGEGWFSMSDAWFEGFVTTIISTKDFVSNDIFNIWQKQEVISIPDILQ
ncbi:Aminopeptidase C [Spathaspora sp. JA1]|nr:Aminopeptidase C [Spathaspora sp. JA1]